MGKLGGSLGIVVGIIMIAVSFILFPIILTGAHTIVSDSNITDYTGLSAIVKVAPTLLFVALLFGGAFMTFQGYRSRKASRRSSKRAR